MCCSTRKQDLLYRPDNAASRYFDRITDCKRGVSFETEILIVAILELDRDDPGFCRARIFLDLVPGIGATCGAGYRGQILAPAATHLMPQYGACNAAGSRRLAMVPPDMMTPFAPLWVRIWR